MVVVAAGTLEAVEVTPQYPVGVMEVAAIAVATAATVAASAAGTAMVAMAEVGAMAAGALASDITATIILTIMDTRTLTATHTVAMDTTVATVVMDTHPLMLPRPVTAAMGMVTATPRSVTVDTTAAWASVWPWMAAGTASADAERGPDLFRPLSLAPPLPLRNRDCGL